LRKNGVADALAADLRYDFRIAPWGDRIWFLKSDTSLDPSFRQNGKSWPWELAVLKNVVKAGDTVLDVGANIGYLTCYLSYLVGHMGHVQAFEPGTEMADVLRMNVSANGCRNVIVNQFGLDCHNQDADLWLDVSKYARQSLCRENIPRLAGVERIRTVKLDYYCRQQMDERATIDLLKIDVEGAEPRVLCGAEETLRRTRNLWLEFWPDGIKNFGMEAYGMIEGLLNANFRLVQWDLATGWHQLVTSTGDVARVIDVMRKRTRDDRKLLPIVYIHGVRL
jgi:FkbM family methyltransferase